MYMKLEGSVIEGGGATIKGLDGDGWFAISSYDFAQYREYVMDIGNANNGDSGGKGIAPCFISKPLCPASHVLNSFFYSPGATGKDVALCITKPARDGKGDVPHLISFLVGARLNSYTVTCSEGVQRETFGVTFNEIETEYFNENENGEITTVGKTGFDVASGEMTSGIEAT